MQSKLPLGPHSLILLALAGLPCAAPSLMAANPNATSAPVIFETPRKPLEGPTADELQRAEESRAPSINAQKIINESNNFLKNREPEMTAAEYSIHEKVTAMLSIQPELAITMLEGMMNEKEKPSPAFALILGNAYYSEKKYDKAEKWFKAAIEKSPDFLRAWNNLGLLRYSQQNYQDAARYYSKAISLGDRAPATYGLLGYCLERQGNMVGAEAAYLQAMASDSDETDWPEGLLRIYIAGKQFTRAESLARQLIQAKPNEGRFWLTLANVQLGLGHKFEAIATLDIQHSLGLGDTQSRLLLADLYAEKHLFAEATASYSALRKADAKLGSDRLLRLGEILVNNRELVQAEEAINAAAHLAPEGDQPKVVLVQAQLLLAKGEYAAARKRLETLVEKAPMNGRALLALALAVNGEGDTAKAAILLEHATHIPESAYPACLELANMELRLKHYDRSLHFASLAIEIERTPALEKFISQVKALVEPQSS